MTTFGGISFNKDQVRHGFKKGPLAGARAEVATSGDIDRRITATRLVLAGPFALAMRKKKDHRQLFLTVEGEGFGFLVEIDPDKEKKARAFATKLNTAAHPPATPSIVSPPLPLPPPPSWRPDPTSRHEVPYWDGGRWTDHVADQGVQTTDAVGLLPSA